MDNLAPNGQMLTTEIILTPLPSLSLFYKMYKAQIGKESFMAKVFPQEKVDNYQLEKQILGKLNHPNIIKPIDFNNTFVIHLKESLQSSFILFPYYQSDLLEFVRMNGSLSERVSKYFVKQIFEGINQSYQKGIIHNNLIAQNILLNKERNIVISGWSNSLSIKKQKEEQILFSIGEIILNLTTSRKPFICRDLKNDAFAKFLTEKHINVFWEQIQRIVKKRQTNFQFSNQLKQLVSALFLKKVDSLQKFKQFSWIKEHVCQKQVHEEILKQQSNALSAKEARQSKMVALQASEKQLVKNKSTNVHRKPSRSNDDIFQEEYQNCQEITTSIIEKSKSDSQPYFRLYDQDLRLVISHLRARLRQAQRDEQDIIDPLLFLRDPEVTYEHSQIKISCNFGWNYNLILENNLLSGFDYSATIIIRQEQQSLWGKLEMKQKSELNADCVFRMNKWLIQSLQHYC